MTERIYFTIAAGLALIAGPAVAMPQTPPSPIAAASAEAMAVARRIVVLLRIDRQSRFVLDKVGPLYAAQVLANLGTSEGQGSPLNKVVEEPGGHERVAAILAEEYSRAFDKHISEVSEAVAARYAGSMSLDELSQVERFLSSPVGKKWADAIAAGQIDASAAGQSLGARAGIEAYDATLRRLAEIRP